jgi:hypothetical protein
MLRFILCLLELLFQVRFGFIALVQDGQLKCFLVRLDLRLALVSLA